MGFFLGKIRKFHPLKQQKSVLKILIEKYFFIQYRGKQPYFKQHKGN